MPFAKYGMSAELQRFILAMGAPALALRKDLELEEPPAPPSPEVLQSFGSFERSGFLGRIGLSKGIRNEAREALFDEWEIETAAEAIEKAEELLDGLHDKLFRDFLNHDPYAGRDYGVRTILAWDLSQMVDLLRQCVTAEYGDMARINELLVSAARRAQTNFTSWQDFAASYLAGEAFWQLDLVDDEDEEEEDGEDEDEEEVELADDSDDDDSTHICDDICRWLLAHPQSPWLLTPWRVTI